MFRGLMRALVKAALILPIVADLAAGSNPLKPNSDFVISIETGDRRDAGTDDSVFIRLFDDSDKESENITLNNFGTNNFKRGHTDTFKVKVEDLGQLNVNGKIKRIELWKEDSLLTKSSNWYVNKVVVENSATKASYVFPVFRWMKNDDHHNIVEYDTFLPQDDPFPEQRRKELENKRLDYVYAQNSAGGGPALVATLPDDERFSEKYEGHIRATSVALNTASRVINSTQDQWTSIEDIRNIYNQTVFETPYGIDQWSSDLYFGLKRIASLNPALIERVISIPDKFPVTDDLLGNLLDGMNISDAIENKRLFIIDLVMLKGMNTAEGPMSAPIALFFHNKFNQLKPVAIQLFQEPGPTNPIFTPENPHLTWELVKMWYNNADATIHQGITHLGLTHLLMEGIAVASHRNLSPSHPISKALRPHFFYLMAINNLAVETLLAEGGGLDRVIGVRSEGISQLYTEAINNWRMDVDGNLREDLKRRKMDDPEVLPLYSFRNDALLLYEAIEKYTTAYVNHYYPTTDILAADTEIQNWASELVLKRGGANGGVGLLGVPGNGKLTDTAQLVEILTCVIFTSSVTHAAVNFPQYDEFGFAINYPLILRGTPPTSTTFEATEQDILAAAPSRTTTLDIMTLVTILSEFNTNSLGDFDVSYVWDPPAVEIINEFRRNLVEISNIIKMRNDDERLPAYTNLLPENIPNAISI